MTLAPSGASTLDSSDFTTQQIGFSYSFDSMARPSGMSGSDPNAPVWERSGPVCFDDMDNAWIVPDAIPVHLFRDAE
jgi:hypothetical protein